jgi:anti-sigma B factor antagonist
MVGERDETLPAGVVEVRVEDITGESLVVRVAGEIDIATAPALGVALTRACARADGQRLVVDLNAVEFLGSAGLRVLVETLKLGRRCGVPFALSRPHRQARRAIQIAGLDALMPIVDEPALGGDIHVTRLSGGS